jgi:hypothetical protein
MAASHTNILPAPTTLNENPNGQNTIFLFWGKSKIGLHGAIWVKLDFFPRRPLKNDLIFELRGDTYANI